MFFFRINEYLFQQNLIQSILKLRDTIVFKWWRTVPVSNEKKNNLTIQKQHFKLFFSRTPFPRSDNIWNPFLKTVSTKLKITYIRWEGSNFFSNVGQCFSRRTNNYDIVDVLFYTATPLMQYEWCKYVNMQNSYVQMWHIYENMRKNVLTCNISYLFKLLSRMLTARQQNYVACWHR